MIYELVTIASYCAWTDKNKSDISIHVYMYVYSGDILICIKVF